MMKKCFGSILTLVLFFASAAFSQGEFLKKGDSGYKLGADFGGIPSGDSVIISASITLGYSYKSIFDVSFTYSQGDTLAVKSLTPVFTYYLSKQDENKYSTATASILIKHILNEGISPSQTVFGFGFSIAHDFKYGTDMISQPNLSVTILPSFKINNDKKTVTTIKAGWSLGGHFIDGQSAAATPFIALYRNDVMFGLSAAIIFGSSPREY